jgi:acyl dehydratase
MTAPGRGGIVGYRVTAHNTATESSNKIHDDAVARSFGFRGGLVPGVDVYAYLSHLPAERWGRPWLERGTMTARFQSPVYDGEEVEVEADEGDGRLELVLRDPSGTVCATATAALPGATPAVPDPEAWPSGAPPAPPPVATAAAFRARPFGSLHEPFLPDEAERYLDDIREHLPLFRDAGPAHPGWLLRFANRVLTANVRMGPWIHVESTVQHLGVVTAGDVVETRALVTDVRERSGHHFVELDVLQLVHQRAVARTTHTAIYQPRGSAPPAEDDSDRGDGQPA